MNFILSRPSLPARERRVAERCGHPLARAAQGRNADLSRPRALREVLREHPDLRVDYAVAVCPETLQARTPLPETAVALVAAEIAGTRLIDNTLAVTQNLLEGWSAALRPDR